MPTRRAHWAAVTPLIAACGIALAEPNPQPPLVPLHERDKLAHADTPVDPAHLSGFVRVDRGTSLRPCRTVFGFLPYWVSPSSVQWSKLTHVACFDVTANASGAISNPNAWPWTSTITTARANGVKVLLTVTGFDPATNSALINTPASRLTFATQLANLIRDRAEGVVLDIEGVNPASPTPGWQSQMDEFVAELRTNLTTRLVGSAFPSPLIYVATPAWNWAGATSGWNFAALAQASDGLFVMGYDYNGSWSANTGASAPLTGNSGINVTATITSQYASALAANPRKLILGVPYYGNQWRAASNTTNAPATSFVGSVLYSAAATQNATYGRQWDASTQTPWYRWQSTVNSQLVWNQAWYDDAQSLRAKYQLAKANNLAGVGMWALTYDASRPELWQTITDEFITPCGCVPDFDQSFTVTIDDVFIFLNAWFAQNPRTDIDASGTISVDDIFLFINAWFRGC